MGGCYVTDIVALLPYLRPCVSPRRAGAGMPRIPECGPGPLTRRSGTSRPRSAVCLQVCVCAVATDGVPLCVFTARGKYWDFHFTYFATCPLSLSLSLARVSTCPQLFVRRSLRATRPELTPRGTFHLFGGRLSASGVVGGGLRGRNPHLVFPPCDITKGRLPAL